DPGRYGYCRWRAASQPLRHRADPVTASRPRPRNWSLAMNLNSDFSARAAVHAARLDWTPSPIPGVGRRMLDRLVMKGRARPRLSATPRTAISRRTRMVAAIPMAPPLSVAGRDYQV